MGVKSKVKLQNKTAKSARRATSSVIADGTSFGPPLVPISKKDMERAQRLEKKKRSKN